MSFSYTATGISQTLNTLTGNTTNANAVQGATTLNFASLSGVAVGMVISSPAGASGRVVMSVTATSVTLDKGLVSAVPSGSTIAFEDAEGVLSGAIGLTIADYGTLPDRQRDITLNGTSTQLTLQSKMNIDANRTIVKTTGNVSGNSQAGILVSGASAVLNISSTDTGYINGNPINSGKGVVCPTPSSTAETFSGSLTVNNSGTANLKGITWYGNNGWTLGSLANKGTINIDNSTIKLGYSSGGNLNTIYNASNAAQKSLLNVRNSLINAYLKLLAIDPTSVFLNVTFFKDRIANAGYSASDIAILIGVYTSAAGTTTPNPNNDGMTLVGIKFGIAGSPFGYFNGHIGMGFFGGDLNARTEGPVATRNTVYGYEKNVTPIICKTFDFGNPQTSAHRAWLEIRKNIQDTFSNVSGQQITAGIGTYFEDYQQHTGALAHANVFAQGAGYTNGNFTGNIAGGTGGTVTITVAGGVVTSAVVANAGSGYSFTNGQAGSANPVGGITVAVNATNFPGVGAGAQGQIQVFPFARVTAEASSGCPSLGANKFYIAEVGANGIANVTSTNSNSIATTTANPNPASSATNLTGIDVLVAIANNSFKQAINSFGRFMLDTRFSANGSNNFVVEKTYRGYLYQDLTANYSAVNETTTEALQQSVVRNLIPFFDTFAQATGISETTAGTYSDITLVTPAPTRSSLVYGDTKGKLIPSTTGVLTTSSTARDLDKVYAKAKYDYTRRTLNETAGNVARTGFGIASFLSASGTNTNGIMNIGNWNINFASKVAQGNVFKSITTTGDATIVLSGQGENGIQVNANNITISSPATLYQNLSGSITGFLTTGEVANNSNITQSSGASAIVMSGDITYTKSTLAGTQQFNPNGATRNIILADCGVVNSSFFSSTNTAQNINILATGNTTISGTLPAGFSAQVILSLVVNLTNAISTLADIKISEIYLNGNTSPISVLSPVLSNNNSTITYTINKNITDVVSAIFFINKNLPVTGRTATGDVLSLILNAGGESNVDFGIDTTTIPGATAFITGSTTTISSTELQVRVPETASFNALTGANAKIIMRRIFENSQVSTIAWRRNVALGTANYLNPSSYFQFTTIGTILVGSTNSVSMYKINTSNNLIAFGLWNTDALGNGYDWNKGSALSPVGVTQSITYPIVSPGAIANITTQDKIDIYNIEKPALNVINENIKKASNFQPATENLPN